MERFVEKPRAPSASYAARYERGAALDDLLGVAHKLDGDAAVAEVPELDIVVVHYLNVPDDHPAYDDYTIVPNGHWLVYSEKFDLLYESSPQTFERDHQPNLRGGT